MPTHKLTNDIIIAAIEGFQQSKLRIEAQIAELRAMLPGGRTEPAATPEAPTGERRKISAAARKRMKEGQQRRWAKIRGEAASPSETVKPEPVKPKRKLSAAGKAAIVAALKKRWREKKAAAKKTAPAVAKKAAVKKAPVKVAKKTGRKGPQKKAKATEQTAPAA